MNLCKCFDDVPTGKFIVGKTYEWEYVIDGITVIDEDKNIVSFDDIKFLWYFKKI